MKNEEKKQEEKKQEVKKQEVKEKEYKYQVMNKDLQKEAVEFHDKQVIFDVTLKNIGVLQWPKGKTKLINDPKSDIKEKEIILADLQKDKDQKVKIPLNLANVKAGEKKCIYHFNVEGKNYGNPLILKVIMKEDENVVKLRNEFGLSEKEFDSAKLFDALKKNNNDLYKTFGSLFNN